METNKPNNPMAFPVCTEKVYETGLTMRDYFAAKAMQAMISNPNILRPNPNSGNVDNQLKDFTSVCYEYADAMLKTRKL